MKSETKLSESKIKNINEIDEETFEDIILEISLKKPVRAFNYYLREMKEKHMSKDLNITTAAHEYGKSWSSLSDEEKKKYVDMEEEDIQRYKDHLILVRKYILEKPLKESASARIIFIDECVKEAIENDQDPKVAKKDAREKWKVLSDEDKQKYELKKEQHKELYEALRKGKNRLTGYQLFMKDQIMQAKEKNEKWLMVDCAEKWKKTKPSIKEKYMQYADEIREERERMRDLYEITFGIKPKQPLGAYRFFLMEQAKEGKFDGKNTFKEGSRLWAALTVDQKERYQKIAKKRQLAYVIKKAEYLSSVRKSVPKSTTPINFFIAEERKNMKGDIPSDKLFEHCHQKWEKLNAEVKQKYYEMAQKDKEKKKEEYLKSVEGPPKRPSAPYNSFVIKHFPIIQKNKPNLDNNQIMKEIAEEWKKLAEKEKNKYIQVYQNELQVYQKQLKEFQEKSFFTPVKEQNTDNKRNKTSASAVRSRKSKVSEKELNKEVDKENDRSRSKKPKRSAKK